MHLDRKDRLCLVCSSAQQGEGEHYLSFDCPAYSSIRARVANYELVQYLTMLTGVRQMHVVDS